VFAAVRFGNVLGSAGSVVPLLKQQISRGGPVTVTHPDCTRYFMTIPEAVGMVLLSGLGGYGDLCILEMGEPIRIAELASQLITMAGLVPGKDIPIVFTGLRPGEKLTEELLTEDEERTQQVRDRIMVAQSAPPPADLDARLNALQRAADQGDGVRVRLLLQGLVPSATLVAGASVDAPAEFSEITPTDATRTLPPPAHSTSGTLRVA
jgi:FlaA1/EpsC-like NDP-sugar epimerase